MGIDQKGKKKLWFEALTGQEKNSEISVDEEESKWNLFHKIT